MILRPWSTLEKATKHGQPRGLATNFRRFALLCPPNGRDNLIKVKELMAQRRESLGGSLNPDERQQTEKKPLCWQERVDSFSPIFFFYCLKYSPSASQGQGQSGIIFFYSVFIQYRASADSSLSLELFLMSLEPAMEPVSTQAKTPVHPNLLTLFPSPKTPA